MDFETSCWSAGSSLINTSPAFYNVDNPVQRRPKIDYFDSNSITPIVSHISSNGYYGYCPTMHNVPSTFAADVHQENSSPSSNNGSASDIDFSMSDMDMPVKTTQSAVTHAATGTAEQQQQQQQQQHQQYQPMHHQGRAVFENRKRTVQCIDEYIAEQDTKRPRRRNHLSVINCAEDMQMSYDDLKDATSNALTNFATNQYFVCIQKSNMVIDQIKLRCDINAAPTSYNDMASKSLLSSILAIEKTENNIAATVPAASTPALATEIAPQKETVDAINNDMETLYWHTHGSLLWQH